ncbi:tRNA (adenine(58)-N(1))-methyltransferase non-catalytic subunit TRM6 [Phlebotomus argentipes]|uniref:tRNA (adenine(58)-N(1))-methyltransferase non-catalytic subunit TRM6 n=1 Tax=Phlebotomus argentipes TaxID=94469 RepID=UPI0028931DED|nr:tRNA (adenine(58)-N(1))-methyltransferase non-catalytic subunit TRM6 [Phlebotomus argentipes]
MSEENIKLGDYIVIQRQKYTKLYKFTGKTAVAVLGKQKIDLSSIDGLPYFSTFRMVPQSDSSKVFKLELCTNPHDIKDTIAIDKSGKDNRDINDDGRSQALTEDEIKNLRETCETSTEIVEQLVDNSKTFASKTEYAQEKYLRRKEKKYYEYLQIRKPSIRLIFDIYFRQDPEKLMGMRMDTLSQIITHSGICSAGKHMVYESGTNGIVLAAFLNSSGDAGDSHIVYVHQGNVPHKQAVLAMNFPESYNEKFTPVNIYSVLRHFYQKDCVQEGIQEEDAEPEAKKVKMDDEEKKKWELENARACAIMRDKVDSLVIVAREHPSAIFKELVQFVRPGRPFVIYSPYQEVLAECFGDLKASQPVLNVRLYSTFLRTYQVLADRTHPDVSMSGNSGFTLCGYVVKKECSE